MPGKPTFFRNQQLPSDIVAQEFGEVNVRKTDSAIEVTFTILMEPQGEAAEGWQTGIALDGSSSMKDWYGRRLEGKVPPELTDVYQKKGWIRVRMEDGQQVHVFQREAYEDAIQKGHLKSTENIVRPLAQKFTTYLAENLDADGGTTLVYWACGRNGEEVEVLGDFTSEECQNLEVKGPTKTTFGNGTHLLPAMKYFVDRFADAKRGMYVFVTDGRLDDLARVKQHTIALAKEIAAGKRNPIKCVLIGVGNEIDQSQMEELDDLETGTDVDIWDHKIAEEMQAVVQIFAEVVDENQIVAPTANIYDSAGKVVKQFTDGLPAKVAIVLPKNSEFFELEAGGQKIRQTVIVPKARSSA